MNELEFLEFLDSDEEESTHIWMTHVCMQAISTMLNIKINILTTCISSSNFKHCHRCKTPVVFKTSEDIRKHTELVHHRLETEEEREGRLQKVRWSQLIPDIRIRDTIPL